MLTIIHNTHINTIKQQLFDEWYYELNVPLTPADVKSHSDISVWWICSRGHIWQARVSNRTSGTGCPFCAGNRYISGETDLQSTYPEIARQWHPTMNENVKPSEISAKSNIYAWWICERGHEWRTKINNRTSNRTGCPFCSGNRVIKGETDLASQYPEVAVQWHPEKNGTLTPDEVSVKSNCYAWWRCSRGHEWRTKIYHRTDGNGCPYCSGQQAIVGETDLGTKNPVLAADWNNVKNGELMPQNVTAHSHKKVWWKCSCGHEWCASVGDRSAGRGCPICSGRQLMEGVNDFATIFPELAAEWYFPKNNGKYSKEYAPHSNKYAYWICEHGHIWRAQINNRANGTGCPFCNQSKLIPEKTSLAVINPVLAAQWHPIKNDGLTVYQVSAFCNDKAWWRCENGHEWDATVSNRSNGKGCPYCFGRFAYRVKPTLPPYFLI